MRDATNVRGGIERDHEPYAKARRASTRRSILALAHIPRSSVPSYPVLTCESHSLTADPVTVLVQVVRIWCKDRKPALRDIGAVEIGGRRRYTNGRVTRVARGGLLLEEWQGGNLSANHIAARIRT